MSSQVSALEVIEGKDGKMYLHCSYGHGSFRCGSYVEILHTGTFHFCTSPVAHGFSLTLKEVLEIAREQSIDIEKQVRDYTDKLRTEHSSEGTAEKTV